MKEKEKISKPFLTLKEASEYLGIPIATLYGYNTRNIIPYHKPQGRRVYYLKDDLDRFVMDPSKRFKSEEGIKNEIQNY